MKEKISSIRFVTGVLIFFIGLLCPLFIPIVTSSKLGVGVKTALSGVLAIGAPELLMILAVAILGKEGYAFLKQKLTVFLLIIAPDQVSRTRYKVGLFMFAVPLVAGWVLPYLSIFVESLQMRVWMYVGLDTIFVVSFIVLGGNFWDKIRQLFIQ